MKQTRPRRIYFVMKSALETFNGGDYFATPATLSVWERVVSQVVDCHAYLYYTIDDYTSRTVLTRLTYSTVPKSFVADLSPTSRLADSWRTESWRRAAHRQCHIWMMGVAVYRV